MQVYAIIKVMDPQPDSLNVVSGYFNFRTGIFQPKLDVACLADFKEAEARHRSLADNDVHKILNFSLRARRPKPNKVKP